jgi:hypothetical protein
MGRCIIYAKCLTTSLKSFHEFPSTRLNYRAKSITASERIILQHFFRFIRQRQTNVQRHCLKIQFLVCYVCVFVSEYLCLNAAGHKLIF